MVSENGDDLGQSRAQPLAEGTVMVFSVLGDTAMSLPTKT